MDPWTIWLTAALAAVGSYAAYITKRYLSHLEKENQQLYRAADRGTRLGEKGATVAERAVSKE